MIKVSTAVAVLCGKRRIHWMESTQARRRPRSRPRRLAARRDAGAVKEYVVSIKGPLTTVVVASAHSTLHCARN